MGAYNSGELKPVKQPYIDQPQSKIARDTDDTIEQDSLISGTILDGRFEVTGVVGSGGMSVVYRGRHRLLDRAIAIKMLHSHRCDKTSILRFAQEAKALSSLDHANVIKVYAFGQAANGNPYLVMDYIEGEPLSDVIKREGPLPQTDCSRLMRELCSGLRHAHEQGIVHRDLKPQNIVIDESGKAVILDFGIARLLPSSGKQDQHLTRDGSTCGSPPYMSPEQCLGELLDERSDIYSLGCIFHELLTGLRLFTGASAEEVMVKHLNEKPTPAIEIESSVAPSINAITLKCLAKSPLDRYQNIAELQEALSHVGTGSREEKAIITGKPVPKQRRRIDPNLLAAFIAGLLIVSSGLFAGYLFLTPDGKVMRMELLVSKEQNEQGIKSYFELADAYSDAGMGDKAGTAVLAALQIADNTMAQGSPQYARILSETAKKLHAIHHPESEKFFEKSLKAWEDVRVKAYERGDVNTQLDALQQCISLCMSTNHQQRTTLFLFSSSVLYRSARRLPEAEVMARKSVEIARSSTTTSGLDQRNLFYANTLLAEVLLAERKLLEALPMCIANEQLASQLFGKNSIQHMETVRSLASCYTMLGRIPEGEATLKIHGLQ